MKQTTQDPEEARLRALLHESRPAAELPPRFQEEVWRRIERANSEVSVDSWLEVLIQRLLRPRLAVTTVVALVLVGALLGVREGMDSARQADQTRYLDAVAHSVLR